jgi:hypothetical protein
MLCTLGGIFCALHFGDSHEVARALLTLRDRAADAPPRSPGNPESRSTAKIQWIDGQVRSAILPDSKLIFAQTATGPSPVATPGTRAP